MQFLRSSMMIAPAGVAVCSAYLAGAANLFEDEAGKDLRLEAEDGVEMVHSCLLRANSEVFRGMLESTMAEGQRKAVSLPGVRRADLRVWLRLLYTGEVDPSDWEGIPGDERPTTYEVDAGDVPDWADDVHSKRTGRSLHESLLDFDGVYVPIGNYRGSPLFGKKASFVRAPRMYYVFYRSQNDEPGGPYWKLCQVGQEDFQRLMDFPSCPPDDHVDGEVGWTFSQKGDSDAGPPAKTWNQPIGTGTWCELEDFTFEDPDFDREKFKNISITVIKVSKPPLSLLLGVFGLVRKYLVEHMRGWLAKLLLEHLTSQNFEELMAGAIRLDDGPLRMHCLNFAKDSAEVRAQYINGHLRAPEVLFELKTLWPQRVVKRRRML